MSAAANAAGYLYIHANAGAARAPKSIASPVQPQPVGQAGTPRIAYRKRRLYALPSA